VSIHPGHARRQPGTDDRLAARHGFELDVSEGFRPRDRREHEEVACVVQRHELLVRHVAREANAVGQLELTGECGPFRPQGAVADENSRRVEADHRPQQDADAFVRHHPAREQNQRA
jgi:hypothetical protein